jgi:hypothetical protein
VSAIADTRRWVYDIVDAGTDLPVLRWLPEAANELPCFVVGRPDLDEDPTARAMQQVTVPVYALGRTLRDDTAQDELDANADTLERLLWKPPQEPGRSGRLTRLRATVVPVGNVEIPAYTATVIVTTAPC